MKAHLKHTSSTPIPKHKPCALSSHILLLPLLPFSLPQAPAPSAGNGVAKKQVAGQVKAAGFTDHNASWLKPKAEKAAPAAKPQQVVAQPKGGKQGGAKGAAAAAVGKGKRKQPEPESEEVEEESDDEMEEGESEEGDDIDLGVMDDEFEGSEGESDEGEEGEDEEGEEGEEDEDEDEEMAAGGAGKQQLLSDSEEGESGSGDDEFGGSEDEGEDEDESEDEDDLTEAEKSALALEKFKWVRRGGRRVQNVCHTPRAAPAGACAQCCAVPRR